MFSRILASALLAFTLLPAVVEPINTNQSNYVTRAEGAAAMLIARDPNIKVIKNTGAFPDIKKGDWYEPYMLAAENFGIVSADPTTHLLRPNTVVNRVQFLKMLAVAFNIPTGYPESFQDVPAGQWYTDYAGIAEKFNIFGSSGKTSLYPNTLVTQAEALDAIQVFLRLYNATQNSLIQEQQTALDQSRNQLTLYSVISTRSTKVVFTNQDTQTGVILTHVNPPPSLPQLRTDIVTLVNTARLKANLKPLKYNNLLENSAQRYAELMAKEGFFGHVSPEGQTLKDRISASGYYNQSYSIDCNCIKGFVLGENLARGQKTADEVMRDWMNSPNHRAAILSPDYTDIGVGESAGVWVEHFGGVLLPGQKILGTEGGH